jgi:hypothetical protein
MDTAEEHITKLKNGAKEFSPKHKMTKKIKCRRKKIR